MTKSFIKTRDYEGACRRMSTENGDGHRLSWLIMTSACAVVLLGYTGWMTSINANIVTLSNTAAQRGERLATIETNYKSLEARLWRIETKIDTLVSQGKMN
jgi:hypothetical protein